MSGQPDLQTQKPYALDRLVQLQGQILQLSQGMVSKYLQKKGNCYEC